LFDWWHKETAIHTGIFAAALTGTGKTWFCGCGAKRRTNGCELKKQLALYFSCPQRK
jgi:hypothetical protein